MTHVHVVFAHPDPESFTGSVLRAFLDRLATDGHTATVSDLYAMGFRAEMSREEYARESGYRADQPVPADVAAEQAKLTAAGIWAFVYPVWWADCPAILKGWFDRVWTAGFAHHTETPPRADKAIVLCTAGYSIEKLEADGLSQAMRATMLTDRIGPRAAEATFLLLTRQDDPAQALREI